jgi:hypothetical protein
MLKWLLTTVIALIVVSGLSSMLQRFGLGRLPGDIHWQVGRRRLWLPITTTILLSLVAAGVSRLL